MHDGLIKNLARPGGNITGMYAQDTELVGKRLEIAKELLRDLKRIGVLFDPSHTASVAEAKAFQTLGATSGVTVQTVGISEVRSFDGAIKSLEQSRAQLVFVADTPLLWLHREALLKLTAGRFPLVSHEKGWARSGALFTYAPDYYEMMKRTSVHVDKILKGVKPGDIPVEQAVTFDLTINQKTAKAFGIAIQERVLVRATEIIR
jgi:putative ABC transport system substrate-binding protein